MKVVGPTLIEESELESIRAFARSAPSRAEDASSAAPAARATLRAAAVSAYEAFFRRFHAARLRSGDIKSCMPVEVKFMSEVLSPCPDLVLRAMYRAEVVGRRP